MKAPIYISYRIKVDQDLGRTFSYFLCEPDCPFRRVNGQYTAECTLFNSQLKPETEYGTTIGWNCAQPCEELIRSYESREGRKIVQGFSKDLSEREKC